MASTKYSYTEVIKYWKSLNIKNDEDLRLALDSYCILFAYNSGAIENDKITYHDTREIFKNGQILNYTGELRTLFEISNQKTCYEYLLPKIIRKEPITETLIKKVHELLTNGTYDERRYNINKERPGEYKKHDYITGMNEVGSSVQKVKEDIEHLINEITTSEKNKNDENILITVAFLHNVLEEIHPFADGNGRVGRTLMNYYLMTHGLPPIIIYNEDKKYYYAALEKFDEKDDLFSTIEFFKYEMEKTWEKTLDRINNVIKEPSSIAAYIEKDEESHHDDK